MKHRQVNEERFITTVKLSKNKKACVEEKLLELMNANKYFTNEDFDMECGSYEKWSSYENRLIKDFLRNNAHRYSAGELLDAGLISESSYTRRKLVYSGYNKSQLLNQKKAVDREKRIDKIFE